MKFYINLKLLKMDYVQNSFHFEVLKERENGVWGNIILDQPNFNKIFGKIIMKEEFIDKVYFNDFTIKILGSSREIPPSEIIYDEYHIEIEMNKIFLNNENIFVGVENNDIFNSKLSQNKKEFTELILTKGGIW